MRRFIAQIRTSVLAGLLTLAGGVYSGAQAAESWVGSGQPGQGGVIRNLLTFNTTQVTLYASTAGSGVFKSANDGGSWSAINNGLPLTRINSLKAATPNFTHSGAVLYAMTDGAGIYRTSTSSLSWNAFNTGLNCAYVRTLNVADDATSLLFAGTACGANSGIYKSVSGGAWTKLNTGTNGMPGNISVNSIIANATGTTIKVATDGSGFYISTDSGATWTQKNGTTNALSGLNVLDIRNVVSGTGDVAALVEGGGVFRTADNGTNWFASTTGLPDVTTMGPMSTSSSNPGQYFVSVQGSGIYQASAANAPWTAIGGASHASLPFARGIFQSVTGGPLYASTLAGVYKGASDGSGWAAINSGLPAGHVSNVITNPSSPNLLYASSDTVYRSTDTGASWARWDSGITGASPNNVLLDHSNPNLMYAATDDRGIFRSTNAGASWVQSNSGLPNVVGQAMLVWIDRLNPSTLYVSMRGNGFYKSTDYGVNWFNINGSLTGKGLDGRRIRPDPGNSSILYVATGEGLYKSTTGGGNWSLVFQKFSPASATQSVNMIGFDQSNPGTVFISAGNPDASGTPLAVSGVWKTTNGGSSWTQVLSGHIASTIAVVGGGSEPLVVYAGSHNVSGGGVLRSTDGGATWSALNTGLGNTYVNSFQPDVSFSKVLRVATQGGVYALSSDGVGAAQAGVLATLNNLADAINAHTNAGDLDYSHLLLLYDTGYLSDGNNATVEAKKFASDIRGAALSNFVITSVDSYDEATGIIAVSGTVITPEGTETFNSKLDGQFIFRRQANGSYKFYGNQRVARTEIQVEMRSDYGPYFNAGPRPHLNVNIQSPVGVLSTNAGVHSVTASPNFWPGLLPLTVSTGGGGNNDSVEGSPGVFEFFPQNSFYGGVDPGLTPITAGTLFQVMLTKSDASTVTYNVPYIGTPLSNTVTGAITNVTVNGGAATSFPLSTLSSPMTLAWTQPTGYVAQDQYLYGYVQNSNNEQCSAGSVSVASNATTGQVTLPSTCNGLPAVRGGLNVTTEGAEGSGQRSNFIYNFNIGSAGLATPTGLSAVQQSTNSINVSWNSVVNTHHYDLYRNGSKIQTLNGTNATSFTDSSLAPGTFSYQVTACDSFNACSGWSGSTAGITLSVGADTQAPTVPTGLTATSANATQINLTWVASTDNVGVTTYKVYRGGTLHASLGNVASYSDTGLAALTAFSYTVEACDAAGLCSGQSSAASATTASAGGVAAATTAVLAAMNNFAAVVNGQGSALAHTHLSALFDAAYLTDGNNATVEAKLIASDMRGATLSGFAITNVNSYDDVNGIMGISGTATVTPGGIETIDSNRDGLFIFKRQGDGTYRFYGNQRIARASIQVEMRTDFGPGFNATPRQHVNFDIEAPVGTLSGNGNLHSVTALPNSWSGLLPLNLNGGATRIETVEGAPGVTESFTSNAFFGGFDPGATLVSNGTQFQVTLTKADNSQVTYNVPFSGTALSNPATDAITGVTVNGGTVTSFTLPTLSSPFSLAWTKPTGYTVQSQSLYGYVQNSNNEQCSADADVTNTATSGQITLPATCGSAAIVRGGLNITTNGAEGSGQRSMYIYNFNIGTATLATPTGLTAVRQTSTSIDVNWTAVANTNHYDLYRNGTKIQTLSGTNATNWPDGSLAASGYSYQVAACDGANVCSPLSASTAIVTLPGTNSGLPAPTNLYAPGVVTSQFHLAWNPVSGAAAYNVYRRVGGSGSYVQIATGHTVPSYFVDLGVVSGNIYDFYVTATDTSGESGGSNVLTLTPASCPGSDCTSPSIPSGLAATAIGPNQVNLSWTASTDASGINRYRVGRCITGQSGSCANIAETVGAPTTYTDMTAAASTSYYYFLVAIDNGNNFTVGSVGANVTTPATGGTADTTAPSVPGALTANATSTSQINLSWAASTDDVGVTNYKVYRGGVFLANQTPNGYSDFVGLAASTTYSYTVAACDAAGNCSDQSASASATTLSAASPAVTLSTSSLSFGNQTVGVASANQGVTLTNSGGATLNISSITNSLSAEFVAVSNDCGTTLVAGNSCLVTISFVPSTTGARSATLSFVDSAAGSPHIVNLSGTGVSGTGIVPLANVAKVVAAVNHTCVLTTTGGAKCWGMNGYGEVGDGATTTRLMPVDVSGLGSGVTAISAGYAYTCALTAAGGVKCWGRNDFGQLGDNSTTNRSAPVDVTGLTSGVVAIAAGQYHACAVTTANGVKCWGKNDFGQLGDNSTTNRLTPVTVSGTSSGITALAAGFAHSCLLNTAGGMKCWGNNSNGQLGDNTYGNTRLTPVDVSGLASGVTIIGAGDYHTCAVTTAGRLKCWGTNGNGQLGTTVVAQNFSQIPVDVGTLASGVTAISGSNNHSCAVASAGAKCWGYNFQGQVGDGSTTQRDTPTDVTGLASGIAWISAGYQFSCAVTTTGGVKCWGANDFGKLGDNTTTGRLTPVDVLTNASAAATAPDAPISVSATAGNAQATVSFAAPANNGGAAITGYTVVSNPAGGVDSNAGTTSLSHLVTGLVNGTAYTFTVIATNSAGTGVASAASNSVTPQAAATVPGAPTSVSASAGNAQATVSFSAPTSNGGAAITSYTVTSSPGSYTASGSASPLIVTGLSNGTAYTFTVRATNSVGAGTASVASNSVTPQAPVTVPGAPTSVSASAGNGQATVSFTAPSINGGAAITGYTVTSSPGSYTASGSASPLTVSGLSNGTAYTFTVRATNSVGPGAVSTASNSVTPSTSAGTTVTPSLLVGFNMLGNALNTSLDVVTVFGSLDNPVSGVSENIATVWKWDASARKWKFHTPLKTTADNAAYASAQGFDVLTSIAPGEGYWVNSFADMSLPPQTGTAFNWNSFNFGDLPIGFNLIAHGGQVKPSAFNVNINAVPPDFGIVPTGNFFTLWAWDAPSRKWYFYSPLKEAEGGLPAVKAYADSQNFLDFEDLNKNLGPGVGFWVNKAPPP